MTKEIPQTERIITIERLAKTGPEGHVKLCPFLYELVRWIGENQFNDFYYHHRRLYKVDITEEEYRKEVTEAL